jgi:hypothetical protein
MGPPDRLLIDEMFSASLARWLVNRGVEARSVAEDPTLAAAGDETIAEVALEEGRVLVTESVGDFELLRGLREAEGLAMPHLIYATVDPFPRDRGFLVAIVDALVPAAREHQAAQHGGVYWLK